MTFERTLTQILPHFKDKLLFIFGPRQAGKTFLIQHKLKPNLDLNMDIPKDRLAFKKFPEFIIQWYEKNWGAFPIINPAKHKPLVFLDEIHKVKGWRNLIKGTYDKTSHAINYVASGSSAFHLRKQDQGDSLAGRAVWLPLFPLSFREYVTSQTSSLKLEKPWKGETAIIPKIKALLPQQKQLRHYWDFYSQYGSFPENLVRQDMLFFKQWLEDYQTAMLDRDLKDLHLGKDVERIWQVYQLLLEGLGSTYSLRSLAETLQVSPNTIKNDLLALRQVLWGFELPVCVVSKAKQIRKEKKFYPIDFSFVNYTSDFEAGARFETQVACLLYRGLFSETSGVFPALQLGFYRDYQQHEIDFVIRTKKEILASIECKLKAKQSLQSTPRLEKLGAKEALWVIAEPGIFEKTNSGWIISIEFFAAILA